MKTLDDIRAQALWLDTAPLEELTTALEELKQIREDLWTPGHITSYMRNRYDLNDEYTRLISQLETCIALRSVDE